MAGLFGLLLFGVGGIACAAENIKNKNFAEHSRREAIAEGKPYYHDGTGSCRWCSTNEKCVHWNNKDGDRCLYSLDLKRELYNFDEAERLRQYNDSIYAKKLCEEWYKKISVQYLMSGREYFPVLLKEALIHIPAHFSEQKVVDFEFYRGGFTKEGARKAVLQGHTDWDNLEFIYSEATGNYRYYNLYKKKGANVYYKVFFDKNDGHMIHHEKSTEEEWNKHKEMENKIPRKEIPSVTIEDPKTSIRYDIRGKDKPHRLKAFN